jgi:hypothetical protein
MCWRTHSALRNTARATPRPSWSKMTCGLLYQLVWNAHTPPRRLARCVCVSASVFVVVFLLCFENFFLSLAHDRQTLGLTQQLLMEIAAEKNAVPLPPIPDKVLLPL